MKRLRIELGREALDVLMADPARSRPEHIADAQVFKIAQLCHDGPPH